MALTLQLIILLMAGAATAIVYRDYRRETVPSWLTIPFMAAFIVIFIIVILNMQFGFLTG